MEMISFYYLLRIGKYSAPKRGGQKLRTRQFLVNYVTFSKLRKTFGFLYPLPFNASRQELFVAMVPKLRITEKKNSFKGACVHHGALERQIFECTVKALARRVAHIQVHTSHETTLVCAYWYSVGWGDVTYRDMSFHMKFAVAKVGYPIRNIPLDRIDTHFNRAGGACAMKLEGFDDESIRKMKGCLPLLNDLLEYKQ